jgi:hypothetical protein
MVIQNPNVSKTSRLHVVLLFQFFFDKIEVCSTYSSKMIGKFHEVLNFNNCFSNSTASFVSRSWLSIFISEMSLDVRATSHTRLRARDHYTSSVLIGGKGGVGASSLPTTLEGEVPKNPHRAWLGG